MADLFSATFSFLWQLLETFIFKLWWAWAWAIPILVLRIVLQKNRAKLKGNAGEKSIKKVLKNLPAEYRVLNDILLKSENDTGYSQIDHIVLSPYCIFVIETKSYNSKATITGNDSMAKWCKNVYGHKEFFQNPVIQNYGHIKTLSSLLGEYEELPICSVVVFTSDCNLSVDSKTYVVHLNQLLEVIMHNSTNPILGENRLNEIENKITQNNITDKSIRKEHIQNISSKKSAGNSFAEGKCPSCGGNLVTRQGKTGTFLGCENYPRCKYTDSIKQKS